MTWKVRSAVFASIAALTASAAGCAASASGQREPAGSTRERTEAGASACSDATPPSLAAPAGNDLAFELQADGVQIYSCSSASGAVAGGPAWAFQAPEAMLRDRSGQIAGTHGAGPMWEALDGSSVVGAKVEGATPDPAAIPWLLLRAASHGGGPGRMADVTFVQRLQTSGGVAPSEGCSAASVGAVARVPYRAVYCFYRGHEKRDYVGSASPGDGYGR
jgi:uncharacterized protein DUF3455